ncbi:Uncharacterised protein [Escherichia coli]|uniref:Transcription elongation factor GreA n=1 Tax=Escherichia coli TaxID=562 RepID=A0A377FB39_ECOLX|nr:Uncharacterised protein [Escherichia coli]
MWIFSLPSSARYPPRYLDPDRPFGVVDYVNVPRTIATVISSGKASKAELDSVLGVQDLWDLLEIIHVDAHNEQVIQENRNGAGT